MENVAKLGLGLISVLSCGAAGSRAKGTSRLCPSIWRFFARVEGELFHPEDVCAFILTFFHCVFTPGEKHEFIFLSLRRIFRMQLFLGVYNLGITLYFREISPALFDPNLKSRGFWRDRLPEEMKSTLSIDHLGDQSTHRPRCSSCEVGRWRSGQVGWEGEFVKCH